MPKNSSPTIGEYIIQRLQEHGVKHMFGVAGDYVLTFMKQVENSDMKLINTGDEQGAGFAADAYARINGLGVVCVTYSVGGFKVMNTTAQAFAEKSPVVVISGAPGIGEQVNDPLLHHKVGDFDTQLKVFEHVTVASTALTDPQTAFCEIDRVIAAALRYKRPVYIEIPRDMPLQRGNSVIKCAEEARPQSDQKALKECLKEMMTMLNAAKKPVILAGVEIHRYKLRKHLVKLAEKSNIPIVSSVLSKSVISELHPNYLGVYEGAMGRKEVRDYVESSDCVLILGEMMTDLNLGVFTAKLDPEKCIDAASERITIKHHMYEKVVLEDLFNSLNKSDWKDRKLPTFKHLKAPAPFKAEKKKKISIIRLFECLNAFLDDGMAILADPGDAMFAAADLVIHKDARFLSPCYYASLGFAIPASLGLKMALPNMRPIVLLGDGSFQMTGLELVSLVRFKVNPIVIVLNNSGYGTERPMLDGTFNDVQYIHHEKFPEILGSGKGFQVKTEEEFVDALKKSYDNKNSLSIIDVTIARGDCSPALKRLTEALGKRVNNKK